MAEPFAPRRRLMFLGLGISIGVALISVILVALVGYQYIQYRSGDQQLLEKEANQVIIIDPIMGDEFPQGAPIVVTARALGPVPFLSTELWVDGDLVEVQSGSPIGHTPLSGLFGWIPTSPGAHSLVARAITAESQSVYSTSVVVLITASEEQTGADTIGNAGDDGASGDQATATDQGSSASGVAYIPPQPPSPSDSVSPGQPWQGSPGEWVTNMTADQMPNAPELIASADTCAASLSIHDLSENEEGFAIYRQVSGSPIWEQVATLAASDSDWLTFTDGGVFGGLLYYVSAFNNQGETSSNLVLVNIDPTNCSPQVGSPQSLTLELTELIPGSGKGNSYCYRSFDGQDWARWPQDGFFEGGVEPILLTDIDGKPLFETLDLMLECWGWVGEGLEYLGNAIFNGLNPREPGPMRAQADNLSVEVLISGPGDLEIPVMYPMDGEDFEGLGGQIDPKTIFDLPPIPALDIAMVWSFAELTYEPDECMAHLPSAAQNLLGKLLFCWPYDGFDSGPSGANPQPYLVWTPSDDCYAIKDIAGGAESCMSYQELMYHANSSYASVGFEIVEFNSSQFRSYEISADDLTTMAIPPLFCNGNRTFKVRMFYKSEGTNPIYKVSVWSNDVTVPCGYPLTSTRIDVTIKDLTFNAVDDGESEPQDIEVFGDFYVYTSAGERWLVFAQSLFLADCYDDDDVGFGAADWLDLDAFCGDEKSVCQHWDSGCYKELTNGSFDLSYMAMCEAYTYSAYQAAKNGVCNGGWQLANNTVRLFVNDNDDLMVNAWLLDYDANSGPEIVCSTTFYTDTFTALQWGAMDGEIFPFSSQHEDANCTVTVEVNGVPEGKE